MKKMTVALSMFFLLSLGSVFASESEGINWFHGTFDELLQESRVQERPIMIDFYADWCGPCRFMQQNVFPRPEIYNYLNDNFIAYKVDVDNDSEGLARRFNARLIPTFLFLNHKADELNRLVGSRQPEQFLQELEEEIQNYVFEN